MKRIKDLLNDKVLIKWSLFCTITAASIYILYIIIKNIGLIIGGGALVISSIGAALTPLFIGIVIAYLLSPAVELIDGKILARVFFKMPDDPVKRRRRERLRFLSSIIITFIIIIAVISAIAYAFTVLILGRFVFGGLDHMFEDIMNYFSTYEAAIKEWAATLPQAAVGEKIDEVVTSVTQWFTSNFTPTSVVEFIANIGGGITNMLLGIVISIYLIKDKHLLLGICGKTLRLLLPRRANEIACGTLTEINAVLALFIRGALLDALIVAILSSAALSILGLRFAVFIGCFAGIANVIPYFGPLIGMIPAFIVGTLTDGLPQGLIAVILMLIIQQLDGNIIYPKVVGSSTGLHPLAVLLAITVAGYYGGVIGMVIAVPVAGILKIFILKFVNWLDNKRQ